MILFILAALLGILGGGAVCVRYLRHEIAAGPGPAGNQGGGARHAA
jgi:hypothetical protein